MKSIFQTSLTVVLFCGVTFVVAAYTPAQDSPSAGSRSLSTTADEAAGLESALLEAQACLDADAIARIVAAARTSLGDRLAEPGTPVQLTRVPAEAVPLTPGELREAFASTLSDIERRKFWHVGLDPVQLTEFPRNAASVVIGCLAARRAGCNERNKLLATAREAGEFLLWTQAQGGAGNFPFPARRGGGSGVWGITERALRKAEAEGQLDQIVRNGWAVDDRGLGDEGGLQIENATGGVAALHLYEATKEERYLHAAVSAAEWATMRPCVPNWNYNSFSVWLLAEAHRITGEARWLKAAKEKARFGIYPGQLTEGPRAGRWFDPHNAKPNYHYILLRAVACLAAQLSPNDPDRELALASLRWGLRAWNPVFAKEGLPNLSSAAEALSFAVLRLPDAERALAGTRTFEALDVLERACATMVRAGKRPADPSAWGLLLEVASRRLTTGAVASSPSSPQAVVPPGNDVRDLKARMDAIVAQGRNLTNRRVRSELEKAMNQARAAVESGDLATADRILSRIEAELAKLMAFDPEWSALLEMDGPLNTNYRRGEGFVIGGTDPHEEGVVRMENGRRVVTTDATRKTFPNQRTDIMTFDARSPQLAFIAKAAAEILGQRTTLKFHSPTEGFVDRLEPNSPKLQFIVNQYFHHRGHDVLASWVLPPGWNPQQPSVVLIGVPGMSHSNNSKMFADTAFLKSYFHALRWAGDCASIVMVQFNCGGRSSMGLHPGFEAVLDEALRWGEKHLGARRDALVLMGGSRGGYGSLCWGARLSVLSGYRIQGIFASVFGIASVETSHPFELVPSVATNYNILGDFEEWKHLLYGTDGAELRRRYFATEDVVEVERLGPLGAAQLLGAASARVPISIYLAFGTADRTALNSSHHRIHAALKKYPGLQVQADFFQGLSHEAGNDERNENAARFVAALARGESAVLASQRRYIARERVLTDPVRIPAHLRLPQRTAPGRTPICDITGPVGAGFEVRILDQDGTQLARETGVINSEEYAMPHLKAPDSPGAYTLEFRLDGRLIGAHPLIVERELPRTYEDLKERWLPAAMPVIEEVGIED